MQFLRSQMLADKEPEPPAPSDPEGPVRSPEEKTALLALLGQPRTVAYALEADARLRPFATTAAIVRSMFWHCKPLKPKSGAKTPKNILKSVLCCSLGSDPSAWDT